MNAHNDHERSIGDFEGGLFELMCFPGTVFEGPYVYILVDVTAGCFENERIRRKLLDAVERLFDESGV